MESESPNDNPTNRDNQEGSLPPGFTLALASGFSPATLASGITGNNLLPPSFFETDLEKEIMNKLIFYDEYKAPPNLEEAWLHAECNKVGKPITQSTISQIKICPCCYNIENEQYGICVSTSEIISMGPVIPMFFHLIKFLMMLTTFFCLGSIISLYYVVIGNCAVEPSAKCGATLATVIDVGNRRKGYMIAALVPSLMAITIVAFILFHLNHLKLREEVDENSLSPSDYSAMVYEIGPEQESRDYLESYIANLLFNNDLPPVQIKKISIGKFEGNIDRVQNAIEGTQSAIDALKKASEIKELTERTKEKIKKKIGALNNRQKSQQVKLENYRRLHTSKSKYKDNSIAFISFNTQAQAECVFQLETRRMQLRWILYKLFPCCFRKRGHYIKQAPEPDDIKWKFIGYTSYQRFWSVVLSYFVTLLLVACSFGIQVGLRMLQSTILPSQHDKASTAHSATVYVHLVQWLSAALVAVMNSLIVMLSLRLSKYERHLSYSMFELHHCRKLIILQFVNSAGIAVGLTFLP